MDPFEIYEAEEMPEGDGVRVMRAFPTNRISQVDPFMLLDEFFVDPAAGFPMHSHSGFEAATYMLDGALKHEDSSGFKGRIEEGEVQHMVTGKGLQHSEMPGTDETNHGLQLWIKLPENLQDLEPSYDKINGSEIETEEFNWGRVKTLISKETPIRTNVDVEYFHVTMEEGARVRRSIPKGYNWFVYVLSGQGALPEDTSINSGKLLIADWDEFKIESRTNLNFILAAGRPLENRKKNF